MRKHPFRFVFGDATKPHVSCFQALTGAIAIARALRSHWDGQHTVGILLPPSVGGALTNIAATLSGRTTVNVNYTAGRTGMESACGQAGPNHHCDQSSVSRESQIRISSSLHANLDRRYTKNPSMLAHESSLFSSQSSLPSACSNVPAAPLLTPPSRI